jgi:hypothetical protein
MVSVDTLSRDTIPLSLHSLQVHATNSKDQTPIHRFDKIGYAYCQVMISNWHIVSLVLVPVILPAAAHPLWRRRHFMMPTAPSPRRLRRVPVPACPAPVGRPAAVGVGGGREGAWFSPLAPRHAAPALVAASLIVKLVAAPELALIIAVAHFFHT